MVVFKRDWGGKGKVQGEGKWEEVGPRGEGEGRRGKEGEGRREGEGGRGNKRENGAGAW